MVTCNPLGLDRLSLPPELRARCFDLAYMSWPISVGCGSNDRQFSKTPHCYFGLPGLYSTAGVSIVPCLFCGRREKRSPQCGYLVFLSGGWKSLTKGLKKLSWLDAYCDRITPACWRWRVVPRMLFSCDVISLQVLPLYPQQPSWCS